MCSFCIQACNTRGGDGNNCSKAKDILPANFLQTSLPLLITSNYGFRMVPEPCTQNTSGNKMLGCKDLWHKSQHYCLTLS